MLEKGIGRDFSSTYEKIAEYFESECLDYRTADKIYRTGLNNLENSQSLEKELKCL